MTTEQGTFIDSTSYNKATTFKQLIHEQINTAQNYATIKKAFIDGRAKDVADCEKAPLVNGEKMPCIIIGSGSSLDYLIKFLRNWEWGIFCTTSQALSLIRYGIEPTHVVALDPFCTYDEIAGIDWSKTRTKLVAHPGVWPSLIQNWPNEIILYLQNVGQKDSFYTTTQAPMYTLRENQGKGIRFPLFKSMIKTSFAMFACSPPAQLFVADKLGYGTAFLCGCDFAYTNNKERFDDYTLKKVEKEENNSPYIDEVVKYKNEIDPSLYGSPGWEDLWEKHEHPLQPIPEERGPMMTSNGIRSERMHIYYKKNFLTAWRLSGKTIYTTDHGAVTEIPYVDIKKVIRKKGLGFPQQTTDFIRDVTDKYLHSVGCYVLEAKDGMSFLESKNPIVEVRDFALNLYQQYQCSECRGVFRIVDVPPIYEPMKATLNTLIEMNKNDPTKYSELIVELSKILKSIEPDFNTIVNHEGQECPSCKKGILHHVVNIDLEENLKRIEKLVKK